MVRLSGGTNGGAGGSASGETGGRMAWSKVGHGVTAGGAGGDRATIR